MNLTSLAHSFLRAMSTQIWQSTLLCAAALGAAYLLRNRSARVRHAVWLLVLARLVLPPLALLPGSAALAPARAWIGNPLAQLVHAPQPVLPLPEPGAANTVAPDGANPAAAGRAALPRTAAEPDRAVIRPATFVGPGEALFLAWLGGVLFLLGALAAHWVRLRRQVARALPAPEPLETLLARLAQECGLRRAPRLLLADGLLSPVACGLLRPTILLPSHLPASLESEELQLVLAHELAHLRRGDVLVQLVAALVRVLYFFHPVAWISTRQLARERELAADETTVGWRGASSRQYASTLLKVVEAAPRTLPVGALSLGLSEAARELETRLIWLRRAAVPAPRWWQLAPMLALFVGLAALAPAPGQEPAPPATATAVSAEGAPESAGDEDRAAMQAFAAALQSVDPTRFEPYLAFETPIERELMRAFLEHAAKACSAAGSKLSVELAYQHRIAPDRLFASFLARLPEPTPLQLSFRKTGDQWKTHFAPWRSILAARQYSPEQIGRRSLGQKIIQLRYGEADAAAWAQLQRANLEGMAALTEPPFNLEQFKPARAAAEHFVEHLDSLSDITLETLLARAQAESPELFPLRPEDYMLSFYLEAKDGAPDQEIPMREEGEPFVAEPYPALTEDHVREAVLQQGPNGPQIGFELSETGQGIFARVTGDNVGRRLAIVYDGQVVSAPMIRETVAGGRGMISGRFTIEEAQTITDRLNAHQAALRELLEALRAGKSPIWP